MNKKLSIEDLKKVNGGIISHEFYPKSQQLIEMTFGDSGKDHDEVSAALENMMKSKKVYSDSEVEDFIEDENLRRHM